MSAWNAATGNFDEVDSVLDPTSGELAVPFDYGTLANFEARVDLSVAGNIMDCGECHVGGGAMEYVPNPVLADRTPLVDLATVGVEGFGGVAGVAQPITAANYTAFNYFIDNYDVDGDGNLTEAQYIDYADAGVMEMDCLMCHLPGYEYVDRRNLLRKGKLGALASVGAGFAAENAAAYGAADFGTTVVYDEAQLDTSGPNLRLTGTWMDENVAAIPDSTNCANCHMNEFSVDWKKRGDHWAPEGQYDFAYEVHYNLGCMGCHQRDTDTPVTWVGGDYSPMAPDSLGHDPAKGFMAQYSGLYNKNDNVQFKDCVDCHGGGTDGGEDYAAPNPAAAHAAAGLDVVVAQGAGAMDGVAGQSHLDMMHCNVCHTRKINSYDWNGTAMGTGNTGNPLIDATGDDHDGRLTDHESVYVAKPDMTDQTSMQWFKGKLRRVSPSATLFWRDKNDTPALDANFDGRPHGMDALLMTDVLAVNELNTWDAITYDNHGVVDQAAFGERITALTNYIETKATGVYGTDKTGTARIKFSIFHVNFMNQHGVSPAQYAWGSGAGNDPLNPADDNVDTCNDCHSATSNFYNGFLDTTGPTTLTYGPSTSQRVPFTKVNGFSQPTDWHPNQFDKFMGRSIAIQIGNAPDPVNGGLTTRDVQISENMYENAFMTAADFAPSYTSSAAIDFSGFEKGWMFKVQSRLIDQGDGTPGPTILRTKAVGVGGGAADVADVAGLLTSIGTFASDFEFDITADGAGTGITITAKPGYELKLAGGVDNSASFKLSHAAYKPATWTGVDGNTYTGRAAWTAYLDTIDSSDLPVHATADAGADLTFEVGVEGTLSAVLDPNATSYNWICSDVAGDLGGPDALKTFAAVGTYTCTLQVFDAYGDMHTDFMKVQVTAPAPAADIALVTPVQPAGSENAVTFSNLPAHTMLYIIWGDGTKQRVYDTAASIDVPHTFRMYSKYFDGTNYNYRTTVYVYNGSSRVDIKRETLTIAP